MKNRFFIILAAVFFAVLSGTGRAQAQTGFGNPSISSPIGPPTVPQSSYQSGLFPSPNPINTTGNNVITGNVGGGKHFRGLVPYNAISDFRGIVPSTRTDSFLRRSASPGSINILPGGYNPFYSPSGTVTTTRPGLKSVVRPPTSQRQGRIVEGSTAPSVPQQQVLSSPQISTPDISYRPMRFKPRQLEKLILDGTLTFAEAKRLVDEQNLAQMERLKQDLEQLEHKAPPLKQSLIVRDESQRPLSKLEQDTATLQSPTLVKIREQEKKQEPLRDKQISSSEDNLVNLIIKQAKEAEKKEDDFSGLDVYERMKKEIENVQAKYSIPYVLGSKQASNIAGEQPRWGESQEEIKKEKTALEKLRLKNLSSLTEEEIKALEVELEKEITSVKPHEKLSGVALSVRAKSIMGEHKTFASFSKDQFNEHMRAAEQYLKEGKYYRAADTYALASLYKSDDPLAYAGKSHALFAAGGYMSSALFLSRTLEIFPEYARFKIDLVGMVGDRDKVESRIADIKEWLQMSDSGELQFLLGYVYYQLGRFGEAKKAIDAAYEKLPDAPAVKTLKKAIDSTAGGN
ncbi:MAG: tetratricopeptide repeat protein [Planctomycetota bacterium]|jgi:tetratricopeptide (TPR) repeat protein